jgi:ribonucleoside-diphosphate reductase alpha chain
MTAPDDAKVAAVVSAGRQRLPNRRGHELLDFEHFGIRYTAGIGRFDDGSIAEIFLNTAKHGTGLDTSVRDAAISASLLLQHGCPLETLRRALTRNGDGSASGPLARALDILGAKNLEPGDG